MFGGLTLVALSAVFVAFNIINAAWTRSVASIGAITLGLGYRAYRLRQARRFLTTRRDWIDRTAPRPSLHQVPAQYYVYVLGSGGHTSEMVELIKKTISCTQKLHRRYIVTTGDTHSPNALARLEHELRAAYPDERYGTHDTVVVTRARRVHQPLWTSPWTCVQCAFEIVSALTRSPGARQRGDGHGHFRYPHVVFTNGPATGFIVAGVAWLLKLLGLTPADRLKVVYVETWAHVTSLSVTGKLMHWTGLPDLFCAQHKKLADRYGKLYISGIVAPAPRPLERVHRSDSNSGDAQSGQEPA